MADLPANVKGMPDVLPPEVSKWQFVEEKARGVLESFAYRELRTPILEYTPLFVRSVGEATEVVEKQMYTFTDGDGASVTMRPEGTAPAVRAYVARSQWTVEPITRWYYAGPMFRHERMQRGRLRQFHQIGAEVFGIAGPSIDAEMIGMLVGLFGELGVPAGAIDVAINTLGEPEERVAYRDAIAAYFRQNLAALDEDSQRRVDRNPMRIFDSKEPQTQEIAAGAPLLLDSLGAESRRRFDGVRALLDGLGVAAQVDPRLVRGLDYYTGTIFELKARVGQLGAQNTVCGGGRYDRLVESLGGARVPAIGFALGIERVLLALEGEAAAFEPRLAVYFAVLGEPARAWALPVAQRLRMSGLRIEIEHREVGLKAQLKRADKLGARAALIVGDNELASGRLVLRDLATSQQHEIAAADLEDKIRQMMD
jgi:histidyl-tRNA synthetase